MYFAIITTGVLVPFLQDPIGTSVLNHPHKKGQKTPMKPTALTWKLQSDYSAVHSRPKTPKTAKIRLFDCNLREEKVSIQPDQPGGNFFWVTTKFFAEKNSLKQDCFFFLLHSVINRYQNLVDRFFPIFFHPGSTQKFDQNMYFSVEDR